MLDVLVDMECVGVGQFAHGLARCRYGRIADDKERQRGLTGEKGQKFSARIRHVASRRIDG